MADGMLGIRIHFAKIDLVTVGLKNRIMNLPRGKGLGGSSSINGMCYVRGNPMDYELWSALGADGWHWANVLPYFQRLEN